MKTSELINQLQHLGIDRDYLFTKGISDIDISKVVVLNDVLFRKTVKFMEGVALEKLPFEICHKIESFDCYAHKKGYTFLGIILFELLFSDQSYIEIKIINKQSEFKQLFVSVDRENNSSFSSFLKVDRKETYKSFEYFAREVGMFPFSNFPNNAREVLQNDLPLFNFSCSEYKYNHSEERVKKADQLILSLNVSSLIQTAELFLDIGNINNKQAEICLENPLYGFGGVNKRSIDARFWLPDSLGFYTDDIDKLKF